jgi:hypothetical protein
MKVLIHPFETTGWWIGWDGHAEGTEFIWGDAAVALGQHWNNCDASEEWEEELDRLESELIKQAEARLGHSVGLAPEYI